MSPKNRSSPRSAAPSGNHEHQRITLLPSRRVAAVLVSWIVAACGATLAGVALPFGLRLTVCAGIAATGGAVISRCALLQGPRAIRSIDWNEGWRLTLGSGRTVTGELCEGFFESPGLLILRFRTLGGGFPVFIDGGRQEIREFRRLCRRLKRKTPEPVRARSTG
jgi:hypothetical protein